MNHPSHALSPPSSSSSSSLSSQPLSGSWGTCIIPCLFKIAFFIHCAALRFWKGEPLDFIQPPASERFGCPPSSAESQSLDSQLTHTHLHYFTTHERNGQNAKWLYMCLCLTESPTCKNHHSHFLDEESEAPRGLATFAKESSQDYGSGPWTSSQWAMQVAGSPSSTCLLRCGRYWPPGSPSGSEVGAGWQSWKPFPPSVTLQAGRCLLSHHTAPPPRWGCAFFTGGLHLSLNLHFSLTPLLPPISLAFHQDC